MPSITPYSPYETLAFFQSVARYGSDASALENISTSLKDDEFTCKTSELDANRFSVDALQALYNEHFPIVNDKPRDGVNGNLVGEERSFKKRKFSGHTNGGNAISIPDGQSLNELIEQLYVKYKGDAINLIKNDETTFTSLQTQISALEQQVESETRHASSSTEQEVKQVGTKISNKPLAESTKNSPDYKTIQSTTPSIPSAEPKPKKPQQRDVQDDVSQSVTDTYTPPISARPPTTQPQDRTTKPPTQITSQLPSPGLLPRQISSPAPQRPTQPPIQGHPNHSPQPQLTPQVSSTQPRPIIRSQQVGSQGRGSPVQYQNQQPYVPYPPYPPPPPPQWHSHIPLQPYQQHAPYGPPPMYYPQQQNGRHPQTPQQTMYPPYPHTGPLHYIQQHQQQWRSQQWPAHPSAAVTTPVSRRDSQPILPSPGSATPWKARSSVHQYRQKSPARPEREVSPLSDNETSVATTRIHKVEVVKRNEDATPTQPLPRRRGRPPSVTPSAIGPSRSQSNASMMSDIQNDKQIVPKRGQKIKIEPPSTPLPLSLSDTEQRSSGRRGRPRSSTLTSQIEKAPIPTTKRKRTSPSSTSPTRGSPSRSFPPPQARHINQTLDPALIIVSKNFAKTSQLLLNEITSHKLAGIFAKPLSERDAPGYKDLVLRPQDLKNIKAAVSKGGRAALAGIETIEAENEAQSTTISSDAGALGNGFHLVPKTPDLVPPKGIVNSAQLEMELIRMFANAIMFNPLPGSERGFGHNLRLKRNGGDVESHVETTSETSSVLERSESESTSGIEEGGIISDAREMFNDVVEIVAKWRELEGERMVPQNDASASRQGSLAIPVAMNMESSRNASVSASSNAEDDTAAVESEAASTPIANLNSGPTRKRRKIAEH